MSVEQGQEPPQEATPFPASPADSPAAEAPEPEADGGVPEPRGARILREITSGGAAITVLAIFVSLVIGALLMVLTNTQVLDAAQYFFADPGATFRAVGQVVGGAYAALFRGGIYDYTQTGFLAGLAPLMQSLSFATPLIAAGLGIGIGFRAGVFNIGGQGQMLAGGAFAGWIAYAIPMPAGIHIVVAVLAALVGGAITAGIAGVLKATTGAHEVIVTIMLNYIVFYALSFLLTNAMKAPGSNNPITPPDLPSAVFPGATGALNIGFVIAIALTVLAAWLMNRSSLGFQLRAVGQNPNASRVAGISVKRVVILTMLVSGAFVGFAGAYQVLGQTTTGFTNAFDAGIGFNAITVALLGRNKPWGIFAAGILFGVFQSGGYAMQASQGIDIDIIQVVQSVIVLFIAAPPLVRAVFRLPTPGRRREPKRTKAKEAAA